MANLSVVLPHGQGFRLIKSLCTVSDDGIVADAKVSYTGNEELRLADHFPGMPIFPGALLLEAMAQTAIQTAQVLPKMQGYNFLFAGVENARFLKSILAPATIILKAKIINLRMGIGHAECKASVNGKVVGEATIIFALVPKT